MTCSSVPEVELEDVPEYKVPFCVLCGKQGCDEECVPPHEQGLPIEVVYIPKAKAEAELAAAGDAVEFFSGETRRLFDLLKRAWQLVPSPKEPNPHHDVPEWLVKELTAIREAIEQGGYE